MKIKKSEFSIKIQQFSQLIQIIDDFFKNKNYNDNHFLKDLNNQLKEKGNINLSNKRIYHLLINYHKYNHYFDKVGELKFFINKQLKNDFNMSGGFFYNKYDNKYMKSLNTIDFIFDIINLIPNQILSTNNNFVTMPYGIISLLLNLFRSDYDFAFYSFVGLIPGIGGVLSSSMKIIHRIIRYVSNYNKVDKVEKYYKQIQAARRVHNFVKDENYEKLNNPYIGTFEDNYNYNNIEDLYLK